MIRINVSIKGIPQIQKLLGKVERGAKGIVARAIAEYILGDENHGLRHYAPWKKVTRKSVYGVSFFSNKQQRAFFAKLRDGEIGVPYMRTGKQGKAWHIAGSGTRVSLRNSDPTTKFTRGQTALHAKMGWQTAMATAMSNLKGALRHGKKIWMDWINS